MVVVTKNLNLSGDIIIKSFNTTWWVDTKPTQYDLGHGTYTLIGWSRAGPDVSLGAAAVLFRNDTEVENGFFEIAFDGRKKEKVTVPRCVRERE